MKGLLIAIFDLQDHDEFLMAGIELFKTNKFLNGQTTCLRGYKD